MTRVIAYQTYVKFAKKYKIPRQRNGAKKSSKELSQAIYKHEMKHQKKLFAKKAQKGNYGLYLTK